MHRLGLAWVVALLLAPGCAGPGIPQGPPSDPAETLPPVKAAPVKAVSANPVLTLQTLRNATYRWGEGGRDALQLRDGKFWGPLVPGSTVQVHVTMLERIGRGDLDGDGVEDAAVVLLNDPGGPETFYLLIAVINQGGTPDPRADIVLGDQIQVGAITIDAGKIFVDVVRPSTQDPSASPARRIKESYMLLRGKLERADTFR